jgi:uncharacterized protein (TIGR02391 family)
MTTKRFAPAPDELPTLGPPQAIALLRRQIERGEALRRSNFDASETTAWKSTTQAILDGAFGKTSGQVDRRTREFLHANGGAFQMGNPASILRYNTITLNKRLSLLTAFIEQLEDSLILPAAPVSIYYEFHPAIESVSGQLLRDGHYKSAALEAFICVIEQVKTRSGRQDLDGDSLMNHAFGCDNRIPLLKFNSLQSDAEKDEQKGIMFLFKGIVGLRNAKAHSNTVFNSPQRAHEYLALASLLMRLLEIAQP